jgi:aminodeoxyfutalosine synthase
MSTMTIEAAQAILEDRNVVSVGARGDEERRRRHGKKTTFARVFEVHADAIPSAMPASASAGEIRIVGGAGSADLLVAAVARARALAGGIPLTGFSLVDLIDVANGVAGLEQLAGRLSAAGLLAVSETPLDQLASAADAIRAVRAGGLQVLRLTVTESDASSRLRLAALARDVQAAVGGIRAFAPLPRVTSIAQPTTGYDDVRQIAVARLFVDNIDSIQVDWQLYGPKLAQVALTMGADDVDNVSALEGDLGRRRGPLEEIRGNITAAGLEPIERSGAWSV